MPSELFDKLFKRRSDVESGGQVWESAPVKSGADASSETAPNLADLKFDAPAAATWLQSLDITPEEDQLAEAIADGLAERREALPRHLHPALTEEETVRLKEMATSLADMQRALEGERAGLVEQKDELKRREAELQAREQEVESERRRQREREEARRHYPQPSWLDNIEGSMNIGVVGNSGVGKSLLINKLRRVKPQAPGWAPVGVCETTREPTKYSFPGHPQVCLWDLPGAGTVAVPSQTYIQDMGLRYFDKVLICTAGRFTSMEVELRTELENHSVPYYMVRTKVDIDAVNNKEDNGLDEAATLKFIKEDLKKTHDVDHVYLVSSRDVESYDMPSLVAELFPGLKRPLDASAQEFVPGAPSWNEPWAMPVMFSPVMTGLQGRWYDDSQAFYLVNGNQVHIAIHYGQQNAIVMLGEVDSKVWWCSRWFVTEKAVNKARQTGQLWWTPVVKTDRALVWRWAD